MKKIIFLAFLISAFVGKAQYWQWAQQSTGGTGNGTQTTGDGKGNLYAIIDAFAGSIGYSMQTFTAETILVKHNASGQVLWAYPFNAVRAYAISADTSGNVYVSGTVWNGAILHSAVNTITLSSTGNFDAFIAKYSPNGNLLWAKTWGDTVSNDNATTLKTDPLGNSYVSGFEDYSSYHPYPHNVDRYFVSKFDPNGNLIWNTTSAWNNNAHPFNADLDNNGDYYITGTFYDSVYFNSIKLKTTASYNIFIAVYDKNGNLRWAQKAGTNSDESHGISLDGKGHFYITGHCMNPSTFGTTMLNGNQIVNMFIAKYDLVGNMLWAKCEGVKFGRGIASDSSGFFIAGCFATPPNNSSAPSTGTLGSGSSAVILNSTKGQEFFVAKYDSSGNLKWAIQPGGNTGQGDWVNHVSSDKKNSCYIVGHFQGNITLGSSLILSSPYTINNYDAFVLKIKDSASVNTSIKNIFLLESGFVVYPNPTDASVNLSYSTNEIIKSLDVHILNVIGQCIFSKSYGAIERLDDKIDLSKYTKGVYFIELITDQKREVRKVAIE